MNESEYDFDELDDFDPFIDFDSVPSSKRRTVRYQRGDINAKLRMKSFLVLSQNIPVQLFDISTGGAGLVCEKLLKLNQQVVLKLSFADGTQFDLNSTVVNVGQNNQYGLKFDRYNDAIGDQLLQSQTDLKFS